VMAWC